jgi:hypothetical protein
MVRLRNHWGAHVAMDLRVPLKAGNLVISLMNVSLSTGTLLRGFGVYNGWVVAGHGHFIPPICGVHTSHYLHEKFSFK